MGKLDFKLLVVPIDKLYNSQADRHLTCAEVAGEACTHLLAKALSLGQLLPACCCLARAAML